MLKIAENQLYIEPSLSMIAIGGFNKINPMPAV